MSTWISRPAVFALGLILLSGCDDAPALMTAQTASRQMTEVKLAGGKVLVSAPRGYCIDKRSVRRSTAAGFALLARCDTLGAKGFFAAQALALITVTTAPQAEGATAPTLDDLTAAAAPSEVIETTRANDLPVIRIATEQSPAEGLSPQHWRSAFAVNGQLVGLALYAPESSSALDRDGAWILGDLAERTRSATARATAGKAVQTTSPAVPD